VANDPSRSQKLDRRNPLSPSTSGERWPINGHSDADASAPHTFPAIAHAGDVLQSPTNQFMTADHRIVNRSRSACHLLGRVSQRGSLYALQQLNPESRFLLKPRMGRPVSIPWLVEAQANRTRSGRLMRDPSERRFPYKDTRAFGDADGSRVVAPCSVGSPAPAATQAEPRGHARSLPLSQATQTSSIRRSADPRLGAIFGARFAH